MATGIRWGLVIKSTGEWVYDSVDGRPTNWTCDSKAEAERERKLMANPDRYEVKQYAVPASEQGIQASEILG